MMLNSTFSFSKDIILRTPALPFRSEMSELEAADLINNDLFMEALFLASPALYHQAKKLPGFEANDPKRMKILHSLAKYFLRMSNRSTPFGLFSGCSITRWTKDSNPVVLGESTRKTRLDMQYLCDLIRKLNKNKELRTQLLYFPNTSHYQIGNEIRYSEYEFIHGIRQHHLSSTEYSEYLETILDHSKEGSLFENLIAILKGKGIDEDEAYIYINELIDSQLLVSELEPKITGIEYIHQIIEVLKRRVAEKNSLQLSSILETLLKINDILTDLDLQFNNSSETYSNLIQLIQTLEIEFDENMLLQTDLAKKIVSGGVDIGLQSELMEAIDVLSRICIPSKRHKIVHFAKSFTQRYDTREVPLLEVLDPEDGIGYGINKNQHISPLTERVHLDNASHSNQSTNVTWDPLQQWIFSKLINANRNNDYEVALKKEDVAHFHSHLKNFPSSTSIVFKRIEHQNLSIAIEGVGGTSASNLLGRFGHGSAEIDQSIRTIIDHETAYNPNVIFCEIVHLPDSRVGNILLRPSYHKYEIPYLAQSSKLKDYTVNLDDIMVSVIDNIVHLRSKRLNKRIIPRLTSAHNSSFRTLPIYEFLCDIQTQEQCVGTYFNWGSLSIEFPFLPRLKYNKTVLFAATWQLSQIDLAHLYSLEGEHLSRAMDDLRKKRNLPKLISLIDRDNELLINLENSFSIKMMLNTVIKKDRIVVREYLTPISENILKNEAGNLYSNQFVASLLNHKELYKSTSSQRFIDISGELTPRSYFFGSEWLYYKIYCGINSADKILSEIIAPLAATLQEQNLIYKYFFIRFDDPKPHLRIRFHLVDPIKSINQVSLIVSAYLSTKEAKAHIFQIQIDSYIRELERYGAKNIAEIEEVFHLDSEACLNFIQKAYDHNINTLRWMYALKSVDTILSDFGYNTVSKILFLNPITNAFVTEFSLKKQDKITIDKAYRDLRDNIENALNLDGQIDEFQLDSLATILSARSQKMIPLVDALKKINTAEQLNSIIVSIIHMVINRVMNANTRQNEFLIYNHLVKAYNSRKAIEKRATPV